MRFVSTVLLATLLSPSLSGQFRDSRSGNSTEPLRADSAETVCHSTATPYIIGGAAVLTFIFLANDQRISDDLYAWRLRNPTVDKLSPVVTELGNGGVAVGLLGAFGAYGYFAEDERSYRVGKIGLQAFAATGIADLLLKMLSSRERPESATRPGGFWAGPFAYYRQSGSPKRGTSSFTSFPSGHVTTAFSVATTFTDVYDDKPWVGYVSYSLATVVAVSRVAEHKHWASDCVVAALLGTYGTKLVESLNAPSSHVSLLPRMDGEGYGFLVSVLL